MRDLRQLSEHSTRFAFLNRASLARWARQYKHCTKLRSAIWRFVVESSVSYLVTFTSRQIRLGKDVYIRDRMRLSYQIVAATMLLLFIGVFGGGLFGSMPPEGAKQSVVPKGPTPLSSY
jgi:hypothetical protein